MSQAQFNLFSTYWKNSIFPKINLCGKGLMNNQNEIVSCWVNYRVHDQYTGANIRVGFCIQNAKSAQYHKDRAKREFRLLGRLLRHNIVHFHLACVRTETFLHYLLFSKTLNTIPKSSRSVHPQYFFNCHLYFHLFDKQHAIARHFEFRITSA
jgi:hypothetical protein